MSGSSLQNFITSILPYAQSASAQTGLPLDYVIAQSALETGYGQSNAAQSYNNYFGISPGGSLAHYSSVGAGFQAYADLVNNRYSGAASQGSAYNIAQYMTSQGYTDSPGYASQISSIAGNVDTALNGMGVSPGTSGGCLLCNLFSGNNSAGGNSANGGTAQDQAAGQAQQDWLSRTIGRVLTVFLAIVVIGGGVWMLDRN